MVCGRCKKTARGRLVNEKSLLVAGLVGVTKCSGGGHNNGHILVCALDQSDCVLRS
jgi:hypothetical protein